MKNVIMFLIKLMCRCIQMVSEIQFWFCDFKAGNDFFFFKVLLPREMLHLKLLKFSLLIPKILVL